MTLTQLMPCSECLCMGYIFKSDSGKIIVIDGGLDLCDKKYEGFLFEELQRITGMFRPEIDAWIFTHPHSDHIGEFIRMERAMRYEKKFFAVKQFIFNFTSMSYGVKHFNAKDLSYYRDFIDCFNDYMGGPGAYDRYPRACVGDVINVGEFEIKILQVPDENILINTINNQSMVFTITGAGQKFLFLGDLSKEGGEKLVAAFGKELKCDVVQLAHHGRIGLPDEVYECAAPDYCLVPTGKNGWLNVGEDGVPGHGDGHVTKTLLIPAIARAKYFVSGIDGTKDYELPLR